MATQIETIVTSTSNHQVVDDLLTVGSGDSEFLVDGSGEEIGSGDSELMFEELGRKDAGNVHVGPSLKQKLCQYPGCSVLKFVKDEQFIPAESS